MKIFLAAALPLLALSGCSGDQKRKWLGDPNSKALTQSNAHAWSRPETTQAQFLKDRFECLKDSDQKFASGGAADGFAAYEQGSFTNCQMFKSCMGARGYTSDPQGNLIPPQTMEIRCR